MVLAKSKNAVGLGNSLMNDRFGRGKSNMHKQKTTNNSQQAGEGAIKRRDQFGNEYITNAAKEADWVKMRSVTEQGALDEFLSTAELAGTDFTAEKMNNVKIVHTDQRNPYLLSSAEESGVVRKMNAQRSKLTVPRRPAWDANTTARELDEREKQSFLEWRRSLAELQEVEDLLMTPFERNLEVWRQLWRVIERADLVVQIVDARNPLEFRSEDLERYVKEVDKRKNNLLLVNKADMMTSKQRTAWAEYFMAKGINFRFFSAELAKEINEAREHEDESDESGDDDVDVDGQDGELKEEDVEEVIDADDDNKLAARADKVELNAGEDEEVEWEDDEEHDSSAEEEQDQPPPTQDVPLSLEEQVRILTTEDLEALFLRHSPQQASSSDPSNPSRKTQIGLVGYPNVGKSSTINALLGSKKVSVSATPGKTKHFQTIHLSQRVILCDCPGLVFPNFAMTKAELVCNGILPIDQLREFTGPAALVARRIPQTFLEAVYGIAIRTRPLEEGGTGIPTGEEVLRAHARARGFFTSGQGQPDESRAARYVLKDYVKGKLLFCHPPPPLKAGDPALDEREFNEEIYALAPELLPVKRRAALEAQRLPTILHSTPSVASTEDDIPVPMPSGVKGQKLDRQFFAPGQGGGALVQPFHYKYSQQGKELTGRKAKVVTALEKDIDVKDLKAGKRHFKGGKRVRPGDKVGRVAGSKDDDEY
nr:hypothetical protein B0A51_17309 [Rachicladosporium sp. CCFEE 5018]